MSIVGHPGSTRTDGEGRFVWQPDPELPFAVLVILPDGRYAPPVLVEQVPAEGSLLIRTQPALVETVTVTTGAAPHIEAPPAAGLRSMARQEIEQRHTLHLADLLEDVPGVGRIDEGHSAVPSIRGLARGRTLVLLDGARVTAERRAGPSATFLDPFFLEGVEVSRGPGSVAYGSDALGGVIDARTKRPEPGSPLRLRFQGSLADGLPERSAGFEIARGLNEGGLLFQARAREFENYRSPAGEVFNSGARDRGVLLRANHEAGTGILSIAWQTDVGREIGKPSADSQACLEAPGSCATSSRTLYPVEDSHRLTASYDLFPRWGFRQIGLSGFLGSYRLILRRDLLGQALEPRPLSIADVAARDFGLRAFAERPAGRGGLRVGLDLNGRYGLEARGTEREYDATGTLLSETDEELIENARRIDSALYLSGEAPLGRALTATGGLRLDRVATRNRGGFFGDRSTAHGTVAGYGALTATFHPGLSATAQIARGFRDPTLSDRYFVGPTGRGRVTGNPDLDPETSLQADLAVRYARRSFRCALYFYEYRIEDLIERFEPDPASAPDRFAFRNRGLARLRGVELEIQGETTRGLSMLFGAQVASGRALDDDSPLADVPPAGFTLTLRQTILERGYLMARAAVRARDDDAGPTEMAVSGHATFDLGGGWRLLPGAELRLLVRNISDKAYPATADARSVLAPGRTGLATLVIDF
ncbi:MAG: TonB-dependent receptor [Acidobacteria bacterium]|nr:TonB-dependent receptor [Acidobacteriota bacterium]